MNCSSHAARAGWKGLLEAVVADRAFLYPYLFSMAVGKNKKLSKGKGNKKRVVDPFTRKEWYDIKGPTTFVNRKIGKTLVNRTQGTRIASEGFKGKLYCSSTNIPTTNLIFV